MPFNSLAYICFLPIVYLIFAVAGDRSRWVVLLLASTVFYAALNLPYLLVVVALVAVSTFVFGLWLCRTTSVRGRRSLLWGGILVNVVILVAMKYLPFISENIRAMAELLSLHTQIQPVGVFAAIGVSYYVFQAISYLLDIYYDVAKPETHFGYFALYLMFFPKLLQGPIEKAGDLIPQLKRTYVFSYENMWLGILMIAWGLFKKVVIADRLGLYVDSVYNDVHAYSGLPLILATYGYAVQIYMDFSGYTDMALGSAWLFNIQLTQNFNSPYLATSIADFWRRWHITFSRWIFGYVFNPLQMQWRNWKKWSTPAALIAAFLVSGIWHGASWGFVIWGVLHGVCMACSALYKPYQKKLHKALRLDKTPILRVWQTVVTFNLVSFLWIFFRSPRIGDAVYVIQNLFVGLGSLHSPIAVKLAAKPFFEQYGFAEFEVLIGAMVVYALVVTVFRHIGKSGFSPGSAPRISRWVVYYLLAIAIAFFGSYNTLSSFIYFQF